MSTIKVNVIMKRLSTVFFSFALCSALPSLAAAQTTASSPANAAIAAAAAAGAGNQS